MSTLVSPMQDTITGFLLAGVGNVDLRRKSNFLIVDQSAPTSVALLRKKRAPRAETHEARVWPETPARAIEDAFKDFTSRDDIAVVLINQYVRRRACARCQACTGLTPAAGAPRLQTWCGTSLTRTRRCV